jgi:formylglycine-generating enzyme required for sulfatase activity
MSDIARVGSDYGVLENDILIPEVVARDSFDVARFEVTRAQWKAFDPAYTFEPGTGNHPVAGITFERAREYARWLADRTGRGFRLPTKAELESLGAAGGNTLDDWVGYTPNPEDLARLRAEIARLPGEAPLLRAVGTTAADAVGQPPVFDLGGNVAEWAAGPDGTGVIVGASADQPKDRTAGTLEAAPAYRGVRVIVER